MRSDYYELMYVIPLKYAGELLQPTVDEVGELLKKNIEVLHLHEQFGKLKFSYPIGDQYQGFYYIAEFTAPTQSIKVIQEWLRLKKEVLRFILIKKDPTKKSSLVLRKEMELQSKEQSNVNADNVNSKNDVVTDSSEKTQPVVEQTVPVVEEIVVAEVEKADSGEKIEKKKESKNVPVEKKVKAPRKTVKKEEKIEDDKVSLEELDKKLDSILDSDIPTI